MQDYNHGQGGAPPGLPLPDLSKPPPGFPPPGFPGMPPGGPPRGPHGPPGPPHGDQDLMPTVPYYDLPAGLMAPLVKVGLYFVSILFLV